MTELERRIQVLASKQHWVIAARQLLKIGLTRAAIDERVRRGELVPVHRGVYKLSPAPLTARGELAAAVLACSPTPLISHESAGGLWVLAPLRPHPVHLTLTGGRSSSRPGIVVHRSRSLHPDDVARKDGLPVTSVARTLVDLAAGDADELRRAVEEADKQDLLRAAEVRAACDRANGKPGVGELRRLLDSLAAPEPTVGELERGFHWLCTDYLPANLQPRFNDPFGPFRLDAHWPLQRLAVELDSYEHHRDNAQLRRDHRKNLYVAEARIELVRLGWVEVVKDAERTAGMLLAGLAERAATSG